MSSVGPTTSSSDLSRRPVSRALALLVAVAVALTALTVLGAPRAHAAVILVVTTPDDVVDPNDGVLSLREAVTEASTHADAVTIDLGGFPTYKLTICDGDVGSEEDANASGDLDYAGGVAERLLLQGGATVEQTCENERVLHALAAQPVEIAGATITGGDALSDGGGVWVPNAALSVTAGAVLVDNFASERGGGLAGHAVTLDDAVISANRARGGGGIYATGHVTITGSEVFANTTLANFDGAGVLADGAVTVTSSELMSNVAGIPQAPGIGGAIHAPAVMSSGSTYRTNRAGQAGAVYASGQLVLDGDLLELNDALDGNGGAVFAAAVVISGARLQHNTAAVHGGAIASPGTVAVADSVVEKNQAQFHGGGVASNVRVELTDSEVLGNIAEHGKGGGVQVFNDQGPGVSALVRRSVIADNRAVDAGGIQVLAVGPEIGELVVEGSEIAGNAAANDAGGINGEAVTMTGSYVHDNTARRIGGVWAGDVEIEASTFARNRATEFEGGAVAAGTVRATSSTFSHNHGADGGGGVQGFDVDLVHTTFVENTVDPGFVGENVVIVEDGDETTGLRVRSSAFMSSGDSGCVFGNGESSVSDGFNVEDGDSCALDAPTDLVDVADLGLSPLADNGGPAPTHMPTATSVLRDHEVTDLCVVATDERGVARPFGVGCDTGAVEYDISGLVVPGDADPGDPDGDPGADPADDPAPPETPASVPNDGDDVPLAPAAVPQPATPTFTG